MYKAIYRSYNPIYPCGISSGQIVMFHQPRSALRLPGNYCVRIFHQPRFPWNKGISLSQLHFGVRSCEVAIMNGTLPTDPYISCNRAARYSGFFGVCGPWVRPLEISWIYNWAVSHPLDTLYTLNNQAPGDPLFPLLTWSKKRRTKKQLRDEVLQ